MTSGRWVKTPSNGPKAEAANGLQSVFTCSPRLASLTVMPRSANGGPWKARVLQDCGAKCMLPNNCRASKMEDTPPQKSLGEDNAQIGCLFQVCGHPEPPGMRTCSKGLPLAHFRQLGPSRPVERASSPQIHIPSSVRERTPRKITLKWQRQIANDFPFCLPRVCSYEPLPHGLCFAF